MSLIPQLQDLLTNPKHTKWLSPLQLLAETALCGLIILKVPYTEIDWVAYMQQIEIYLAGERDYAKISGDTGPLVYPAMHVYIYRILHYLTSSGTDILSAQIIFSGLYVLTLLLVIQTYRAAGVPPWVLPLLSLSKRVHSIFVLRLFNDCFAVAFLFGAVACWQRKHWMVGTLVFSAGLGVKMSLLLCLPGIGAVMWQGMGRNRAFYQAQSIAQFQTVIAYPFFTGSTVSYLGRAFELTRQFLFKWTVNWRFVGEQLFLSRPFSAGLLVSHLGLLYLFGIGRWLQPSDWTLPEAIDKLFDPPPQDEEARITRKVNPRFILTTILSSLLIGCLCARSLHYQFFVYIAWSTPFLLWRSGMHPILVYAICGAQEWAWNVYPSTNESSMVVIGCLAATLFSVWIGTSPFLAANNTEKRTEAHEHVE